MEIAHPVEMESKDSEATKLASQDHPTHGNSDINAATTKKSLSFILSVVLLGLLGMVVALDSTSLIVALPVRHSLAF